MKIKSLVLLLALLSMSACSFNSDGELNADNELSQKRSEWAQFEDERTREELSIFDESSSPL